jgi:hypothetical protein
VGIVAPSVPEAVVGSSVYFNDAQSIGGAADQVLGVENAFSLMMWVRPDNTSGNRMIDIEPLASEMDKISLRIVAEDGVSDSVSVRLYNAMETQFKRWNWSHVLPLGAWSHVVSTWDGAGIRLYVNAVEALLPTKTTNDAGAVGATPRVVQLSQNETYAGVFHQAAVWSSVLTLEEILRIYNAGKTGVDLATDSPLYTSSASLQHWYRLGEDPAQIGLDYGNGTAHNLTTLVNLTANDITSDAPGAS